MPPVIVRAPLRINLAGDLSAMPAYADPFGGLVVQAAIGRYCYVVAEEPADGGLHIHSADLNRWETCVHGVLIEIGEPLQIVKAAMEYFGDRGLFERGVSLFLSSQAPPGAGLGASGAMGVALVRALATYLGIPIGPAETAEVAGWLEIERLGRACGKEDHYAAAYGGINAVVTAHGEAAVRPIAVPGQARRDLARSLLLFRLDGGMDWIDARALENDLLGTRALHELKLLAEEMRLALTEGDLATVGCLLDMRWEYRRRLMRPDEMKRLDALYESARAVGALGGAITRRGGSLLLFASPERRESVRSAMDALGLRDMPFELAEEGAQVLAGSGERSVIGEVVAERTPIRTAAAARAAGAESGS